MKKVASLFCLLLLIAINACSRAPELTPLDSDDSILAFGDSITAGTGAGEGEDYPAHLEKLTGHKVINGGLPGELAEQGLARLPQLMREYHPSLVIICHGGNNFLGGQNEERVKVTLRLMIQIVRSENAQAVLIGVPKPGLLLRDGKIYGELARELSVPYSKNVLSRILSNPVLKADQIHPNAEGYKALAQAIQSILRESGALRG